MVLKHIRKTFLTMNGIWMNKGSYPRVLVISHNCLSKRGSNGRTLANFLINWPIDCLAQFYISNEIPDSPVCKNYFRVTDTEALKAFLKGIEVGGIIKIEQANCDEDSDYLNKLYIRHRKRTAFNYIVRNFIWDSNRWRNKSFEEWVDKFNPDVVLLQLGDYAFMLRIALSIAKERNIPLVVYNSEDYYFKDRYSASLFYHYYRRDYKRQVRKLLSYASQSIYISDMLRETYEKQFQHDSTTIMTSTDMVPAESKAENVPLVISYLGNLGVGRHEPLIEIAKALHEVFPEAYLDIYGKMPNKEVEQALSACLNIRLKGFVSYNDVVRIMQHSDLLVHAENFSDFYQWDLKHAFSTKIADSLASGTCMFVYGPESISAIRYLAMHNAACVVIDARQLQGKLREIVESVEMRKSYVENALKLAKQRHSCESNCEIFHRIIENTVKSLK
jgi:glycosyltransferase involved in cell wall biosynthesis